MTVGLIDDGTAVRITVFGVPQTQAGTKSVPTPAGRREITTGSKDLLAWRQDVAAEAEKAMRTARSFDDDPVEVTIEFRFPMRKSTRKADQLLGVAFRAGRTYDIDKLARAILDSLTRSGLIRDDGAVVDLHCTKREHASGWVGADIIVRPAQLIPGRKP